MHSIFVCACLYVCTYVFYTCMYFQLVTHSMYSLYSHLIHLSHTYTWAYVQFVQPPYSSVTNIHLGLCTVCTVTCLRHLSHMYTWVYIQFVQSPSSSVTHVHLLLCTVYTLTFRHCYTCMLDRSCVIFIHSYLFYCLWCLEILKWCSSW